jgi:8-oxo-dGTP diphosphatase
MIEKVEFTNMCMVYDGDKAVVIDRQKKDWPGITFPGGHVEEGESFTDSVIREIREETGLKIYSPQLCGIKDWYENECRYVVLLYKTSHFEGDLISSDEGKVWWEKIDNLENLRLSNDMKDILRVFLEDDLSEFYYYKKSENWQYELK